MIRNNQKIVWDHIIRLYNEKKHKILRKSYKLTAQHVYLDSYTCMKVQPAAQVLSNTVATDLGRQNWPGTSETVDFMHKCNNWFDNLNGPHSYVGGRKNNKRLFPYRASNDWRFAEMEGFLEYLSKWKEEAYSNPSADISGITSMSVCEDEIDLSDCNLVEDNDDGDDETPADKKLLAWQTQLGIEMSTLAIMDAIKFLLKELEYVNPRVFCQDPLEQYFSKQRDGCGGSTNPNFARVLSNQRSIHVVGNIGIQRKRRGNSTEIVNPVSELSSDEPLQKRKRALNKTGIL